MSCIINKREEEILVCSTGLIEDLFYAFLDIIREDDIKIGHEFEYFLFKLEGTIITHGGAHIDVAVLFHSSRDVSFLLGLLEKTIPRIRYGLKAHAVENRWKFHAELVKYKEELEAQGK